MPLSLRSFAARLSLPALALSLLASSAPGTGYIGRTETTWGQYRVFCRSAGRKEPKKLDFPITDEHPVVNVSWEDAKAFCDRAG